MIQRFLSPSPAILSALLVLTACAAEDDVPTEPEVELAPAPLGEGFTAIDIGAVGATGSYRAEAGVHTLEGAGADIWTGTDAFRFVYQTLPGDGTITARVASLENTNATAKAGVMMRESTAAGSKNAMALLTPTSANGYRFQVRTTTGGTTTRTASGTGIAPRWLRLTRAGNSFTAHHSANGTTWTAIGSPVTISMTSTILVGLAVTSHAAGTLATAAFDNVTFTTPTPPPPPPPPGAPQGLTATAGNAQVALAWSATSGATSYTVRGGTTAGGPYGLIQAGLTTPAYTHTGLTNGTTYHYVVSASNAQGEGPTSAPAQATPALPPPATFASQDIGSVGATGNWSENPTTGTHTLNGAGGDIYGTADAFRFAHQSITGDVTITARVQSLQNRNAWTKAVVMVREDLTAGARNVAAVVSPTATNKYRLQVRSSAGGTTTSASSTANSAIPSWLRMQRTGNVFRAFHSTDGTTWTQIGSNTTLAIGTTARVGLGVTSHVAGTLATAVFTNVTITTPAPPPPPPPPPADAGADAQPDAEPDAGAAPDASADGSADAAPAAPNIQVSAPELIFSAFRNTTSVTRTLVIRNAGTARLNLAAPVKTGPSAASFVFVGGTPGAVALDPGAETTVRLAFTATSTTPLGPHNATLRLSSDDPDQPVLDVALWALCTLASEGANEPPLKQVVDTLGYAINVGGTALQLGTGAGPIGDEVLAPRFRRAGPGPVTMTPVARYSPDEPIPFGLYRAPSGTVSFQRLGTIRQGQFQTLLPEVEAGSPLQADVNDDPFGVYTTSATHSTFTEDARNTGTVKHAVRSYPLKNRSGQPVPNHYLVGFEEAANGDYQDYVFVLGNVVPVN